MGKWTRRAFIGTGVLAGGGLLVGVGLGIAVRPGNRTPKLAKFMENEDETLVNAWVKLLPDNSAKVIVPHAEMGQGAHSALPMMLADEMDLDWQQVSMEEAPAHDEYVSFHMVRAHLLPGETPGILNDTIDGALIKIAQIMSLQITGGSYSVRGTGQKGLRVAGAAARELLINAAAEKWQVPESEIRTEKGVLYHDSSSRSEPYINFAKAAAAQKPPQNPTLKTPDQFNIMGKEEIPRLDIPAKVDGSAVFGVDVELPNMRYATVKASPVFGNTVESFDASVAEKMAGVIKVVNLGNAIGVIAEGYWQAKKAIDKIDVVWSTSSANSADSASIFAQFAADMDSAVANSDEEQDFSVGDARRVLEKAEQVIEAEYQVPYLAHTTMEPMNCTALVKDGKAEIWSGMQSPLRVRNAVAEELGIEPTQVVVNNQYLGGGFGRRARPDYPLQATKLAKTMPGTPIKMIWSREEDVQQDHYRQAALSRFKATLDKNGMPIAWENQYLDKRDPEEAPDIPYSVENKLIHHTNSPTHVPFGPWRSVDHSHHAFFTESFIDELAHAAGIDPLDYRRTLLASKPRHQTVLGTVAKMSGWGKRMPQGWAQGVAIHRSFKSIVAQVVDLDMSGNQPRVDKVYCASDAGLAVSPNGFRAQMESGIIFGLTAALYGEVNIKDGAVLESNFHNYQMVRMDNAPDIEVQIINSGAEIGGAGEPGTPPIAPALANAVFAATGKRVRSLPIKLT